MLETLVRFGAPEHILYEHKPHIGTDILSDVVLSMRTFMEEAGARFLFETCLTDYRQEAGHVTAVELDHAEWIETDHVVFAIGHSARDTFRMLDQKGELCMTPKSFAVGFRVEHPQHMINLQQYGETYADKLPAAPYKVTANLTSGRGVYSFCMCPGRVEHPQHMINLQQYGETYADKLPAAPYKVTANLTSGRGVYSFCMCPGGYVVNASSEEHRLAVNGMSYSGRDASNANSAVIVSVTPEDFDGKDALSGVRFQGRDASNANSAVIVSVTPEDFDGKDALSGVRFQEQLEERAYALANGAIPQQLFGDYCADRASASYGGFASETKGTRQFVNLRGLLPAELEESLIEGMHVFARALPEFDRADAILSGVESRTESRTSSPVRIPRNETFEAAVGGIYPCGEGAGYAGGILSAAMDGLKVAEAILKSKQN